MLTTSAAQTLFGRICIATAGNEQAMQTLLSRIGFVPAPPTMASAFVEMSPGTAWLWADPAAASLPLAVVTRSTGVICQVMSPLAVPAQASVGFHDLMEGLRSAGAVVRTERSLSVSPDGRPGAMSIYHVTMPRTGNSFRYALSAREPVPGSVALLMTASHAE